MSFMDDIKRLTREEMRVKYPRVYERDTPSVAPRTRLDRAAAAYCGSHSDRDETQSDDPADGRGSSEDSRGSRKSLLDRAADAYCSEVED